MKTKNKNSFLRILTGASVVLLLTAALAVMIFDPFYHYHGPLPGLKAVLTDKEYQCIGSIRNLDYDSLLVGSSVVENFDNSRFDDSLGTRLIKAVRASGSTADLCYYINEAYASKEKKLTAAAAGSSDKQIPVIRYIFYNIDNAALYMSPETSFKKTGQPMYLYNKNPLDDILYLWNKDVLLEKIPYMLANSFITDYREGLSYNWSEGKVFGEAAALSHYTRPEESAEMLRDTDGEDLLIQNLELIGDIVSAHPETEFVFYYPPYSVLWWDEAYRTGKTEMYLHAREKTAVFLQDIAERHGCRVHLADLQPERGIIFNLDNYMDTLHFSPEITDMIFERLASEALDTGEDRIDIDEMRSANRNIREMLPEIEEYCGELMGGN